MSNRKKFFIWLAVVWAGFPALWVLMWLIFKLFHGFGVATETYNLWWNANIWDGSALLWWYIIIIAIITAVLGFTWGLDTQSTARRYNPITRGSERYQTTHSFGLYHVLVGVLGVVVLLGAVVQLWRLNWDADKDLGRYYNSATTFYTPSLKSPPASLQYLLKDTRKGSNGCTVDVASDVPNCVKVGTLSSAGFAPRSSSASGALLAMNRTSGATQNVDLLSGTLVYLQGKKEWSAIRDGSGNSAHTEGVVTWKGDGTPSECYFGGNDQFDKAIKGSHTNSLSNVLANKYPTLYWTLDDTYGYCQNGRPVLAFVMREQQHYLSQAVSAPAGVVLVTGSPSGAPTFTYKPDLTDSIGPSYPFSVAEAQLQANVWAAGRSDDDHGLFGYQPDYISAQPFLLKSNADGHTYIVTPMTLNSSQSNLFVAYGVVRADTVRAGHLNPMSIYVLGQNDIRRINIDSLEAQARTYLAQQVPGFFSSGGSLVDYTPTVGDVWRTFGEVDGRVVYRLDISASNAITPNLVSLENFTGKPTKGKPSNAFCGQPVASLTQAQIQACIKTFAGALGSNGS